MCAALAIGQNQPRGRDLGIFFPGSPGPLKRIATGVLVAIMTAAQVAQGIDLQKTHRLYQEAQQAETNKQPLTEEQTKAKKEWEDQRKYFQPSPEDLKKETAMYSGTYLNLLQKRAAVVKEWHSMPFYMSGWDMLTMM